MRKFSNRIMKPAGILDQCKERNLIYAVDIMFKVRMGFLPDLELALDVIWCGCVPLLRWLKEWGGNCWAGRIHGFVLCLPPASQESRPWPSNVNVCFPVWVFLSGNPLAGTIGTHFLAVFLAMQMCVLLHPSLIFFYIV